ncbi:MAG: glycerophosphodiester phosphodiesterase [Chloroflexi bacterium]|nr:glycerophosphodiester phosphodiesterase [Chloroflexota bacterium]
MLCIGHRGAMGHVPENTLLSVQTALEMGADWIEIDVYLVEDQLVVIHDPYVDRTTNGTGEVMSYSFADLRALDAGGGQQIPVLEEIFGAVNRQAGINIELKGAGTADPVVSFIHRQLEQGWTYDEILVSSFDHNMLRTVHDRDSNIKIGALIFQISEELLQSVEEMGASAVNPWLMTVTESFVQDAHARGLKVYVYTVNELPDIERMRGWHVDGIFTNYPDRVHKSV